MLPHVDVYRVNATGARAGDVWRNVVRFSPTDKYGGGGNSGKDGNGKDGKGGKGADRPARSYEQVLIEPAVKALKGALGASPGGGAGVSVQLSLSGEQGLSTFAYPAAWQAVMGRARAALAGAGSGKHEFGVCLNWNKVCGCVEPQEPDPLLYNGTYYVRLARWRVDPYADPVMGPRAVDLAGAKRLLEASGAPRGSPLSDPRRSRRSRAALIPAPQTTQTHHTTTQQHTT